MGGQTTGRPRPASLPSQSLPQLQLAHRPILPLPLGSLPLPPLLFRETLNPLSSQVLALNNGWGKCGLELTWFAA